MMASKVSGFFALDLLDNRFPALHGMRVLAILSVIAYHVTWIFMAEQGILLDPGFFTQSLAIFFGMDLFFILSGFLIGSILLRSIATTGVQHIKRFYLRRIFRTFPSYYLVLTALVLAFGLTANQRHHLVWEYVYGTNFMPLDRGQTVMFWGWSLALEEQFYLTVPFLFLILKRLRTIQARLVLVSVLWLAALAVRLVIFYRGSPWNDMELYGKVYFRTHTRFDLLIAGIVIAIVHQRWGKDIAAWLKAPFHRVLLALPALACFWFLLRVDRRPARARADHPHVPVGHGHERHVFRPRPARALRGRLDRARAVVARLPPPGDARVRRLPRAHPDHRSHHGPRGSRGAGQALVDALGVAGRAGVDVPALAGGRLRPPRGGREAVAPPARPLRRAVEERARDRRACRIPWAGAARPRVPRRRR
jgi:hypothetical protein